MKKIVGNWHEILKFGGSKRRARARLAWKGIMEN